MHLIEIKEKKNTKAILKTQCSNVI